MGAERHAVTAREVARARFRASTEVPTAFFDAHADGIARACRDLARAFHAGHRLLVFGSGAQESDALHVSVEFVHPVIVGKRALPALALRGDPSVRIRAVGEAGDVAMGVAAGPDPSVRDALAAARERGLVTLALTGPDADGWSADYLFPVPSGDPYVVQEVHETAYHVLWELVHLFLDHPETLR